MALILADRVREISSTSGTGNISLSGAVVGYQSFAVIGDTNTTYYCLAAQTTDQWEVGVGTYSLGTNTLARTTVLSNSDGTQPTKINFLGGTKDIFVTYPEDKAVYLDGSGNVIPLGTISSAVWNGSTIGVVYGGTGASNATDARTNLGLGTIVTQNANSVAITGGSVNGTTVGASTASTGSFTNFVASGTATFTSNEAVKIPVGSTAQRPTPSAGMLRFNSTSGEFEGYSTVWASVGGSAITNDTATATDVYPLFADATSGTAANVYTSNSKLLYKPSTGELKSSVLNAGNGIVINNQTVAASYAIASGENAMSVGPITVDSGQTVTVASGSRWVVL